MMNKLNALIATFFIIPTTLLFGQFTFTNNVQGQSGIDVDITITFNNVIVNSANCTNGFNYQIQFEYDITYNQFGNGNGNNTLNTLQGYLACGSGNQSFFNLPNNGGSGVSTTANNWTSLTNCSSIQVQDLMCDEIDLVVQGPGVPNQTIRLTAISTLPVAFIDFTAASTINGNLLKWSTASEKNNDYFTIERSIDGKTWDVINTVNGAGTTSDESEYSFLDEAIYEITYYRLKQFDFDGTETELKVISVKNKNVQEVSAYPNPAENTIFVTGTDSQNLQLFDATGADRTAATMINSMNGKIKIDISNLNRGIYFLFANGQQVKIIKQ